jgi:hypothetical protein
LKCQPVDGCATVENDRLAVLDHCGCSGGDGVLLRPLNPCGLVEGWLIVFDNRSAMDTRDQPVRLQLQEVAADGRRAGVKLLGEVGHGGGAAGTQGLQDELVSSFSQHATGHYTLLAEAICRPPAAVDDRVQTRLCCPCASCPTGRSVRTHLKATRVATPRRRTAPCRAGQVVLMAADLIVWTPERECCRGSGRTCATLLQVSLPAPLSLHDPVEEGADGHLEVLEHTGHVSAALLVGLCPDGAGPEIIRPCSPRPIRSRFVFTAGSR